MEKNVLLQLSHISKRYKTELALKDISITLHKGETVSYTHLRCTKEKSLVSSVLLEPGKQQLLKL